MYVFLRNMRPKLWLKKQLENDELNVDLKHILKIIILFLSVVSSFLNLQPAPKLTTQKFLLIMTAHQAA